MQYISLCDVSSICEYYVLNKTAKQKYNEYQVNPNDQGPAQPRMHKLCARLSHECTPCQCCVTLKLPVPIAIPPTSLILAEIEPGPGSGPEPRHASIATHPESRSGHAHQQRPSPKHYASPQQSNPHPPPSTAPTCVSLLAQSP